MKKSFLNQILVGKIGPEPLRDALLEKHGKLTAILADQPCKYYFEDSSKEYWDQREEFKNVTPHEPLMWIEFKAPKTVNSEVYGKAPWERMRWARAGVSLLTLEKEHWDIFEQGFFVDDRVKWISAANIYIWPGIGVRQARGNDDPFYAWRILFGIEEDGTIHYPGVGERKLLDSKVTREEAIAQDMKRITDQVAGKTTGDFIGIPSPDAIQEIGRFFGLSPMVTIPRELLHVYQTEMSNIINVVMLTVYLMHAKGVKLTPVRGMIRKKKRKQKKRKSGDIDLTSKIKFKILDLGIDLNSRIKNAPPGRGLDVALQEVARIGYWREYTEGKPMFGPGGYVGPVWTPPGQTQVRKKKKPRRYRNPHKPRRCLTCGGYRRNAGLGRNEPCPCGSGKKYKKCCLQKGAASISNDMLYYKKFVIFALIGQDRRVSDQYLRTHRDAIERIASEMRKTAPTPLGVLYRGVVTPSMGDYSRNEYVSYSQDKNVACYFARPDSWMNKLWASTGGLVIECTPTKNDVLFHHKWANTLSTAPPSWDKAVDEIAKELPSVSGRSPEEHRNQIAWEFESHLHLKPQKEVILKSGVPHSTPIPVGMAGCLSAAELDSLFRPRPDWVLAPPGLQSLGVMPGTKLYILRLETVRNEKCLECRQFAIDAYYYFDHGIFVKKCSNCQAGIFGYVQP